MRRALLALMFFGLPCAIGWAAPPGQDAAQEKPDFSGRWVLEKVDPERFGGVPFGPDPYGPPGGGRFGGRPGEDVPQDVERRRAMPPMERGAVITITQSETELVTRFSGHERVYRLVPAAAAPAETPESGGTEPPEDARRTSRTYWDDSSLVTETEESFDTPRGNFTFKSREVRTLSDDGETMTVERTVETPRGTNTVTQTFRRRGKAL